MGLIGGDLKENKLTQVGGILKSYSDRFVAQVLVPIALDLKSSN